MPSFLFCPRQQLQQIPQGVRRPHHGVRHKHCDGRGTTGPPLPPPSHFLTSENLRPTSLRAVEGSGGGGDIRERAAAARAAFLCSRCSGFSLCAQAGRCCWWRRQLAVFLILAGGGVGCAWVVVTICTWEAPIQQEMCFSIACVYCLTGRTRCTCELKRARTHGTCLL